MIRFWTVIYGTGGATCAPAGSLSKVERGQIENDHTLADMSIVESQISLQDLDMVLEDTRKPVGVINVTVPFGAFGLLRSCLYNLQGQSLMAEISKLV